MNSMVKHGWIEKIEQDEGLGRSEQIWCITKSGRLAAQTENDLPTTKSEISGFSVSEYFPALCSHTKAIQVIASHLSQVHGWEEIRPFTMDVCDQGKPRHLIADIIFDNGIAKRNGHSVSIYEFYKVELTLKPLGHYQSFLNNVALFNKSLDDKTESFSIGRINFIVPRQIYNQFEDLLLETRSKIQMRLFCKYEILNSRDNLIKGKDLKPFKSGVTPREEI